MATPIIAGQDQIEIDQNLCRKKEYNDYVINEVINHPRLRELERVQSFRFPVVPEGDVEVSHFSDTSPSTDTSFVPRWVDSPSSKIYDKVLPPTLPQPQDLLDAPEFFNRIDDILDETLIMVSQRTAALAEESAEVELLFAQAQKFNEINKRLAATQSRVINLGRALQEALGPVYNDTQSLQIVTDSKYIYFRLCSCLTNVLQMQSGF